MRQRDNLPYLSLIHIFAGGGVVISDATNEFRKFVKETDIPVVSTMLGIGILPSDNPRYYGMIGSHGVKRRCV